MALRNLKASLSNPIHVLEPHKQARAASTFIQRIGQVYRFNVFSAAYIDVEEFDSLFNRAVISKQMIDQDRERDLRRMLTLYKGEFLADEAAYDICQQERQRLADLYIKAGEELARMCMMQKRYEEAAHCCDAILKQDPCWEKAYQLKMWSYGQMQNPVMVARTYRQCCEILRDELGVKPSQQTTEIYKRFID